MVSRTTRARDLRLARMSRCLLALVIISMSEAGRGDPGTAAAVVHKPCGFTCNGSCAVEPTNTTSASLKPRLTCRSSNRLVVEWSAELAPRRRLLAQLEKQNEDDSAGECINVTSSTIASFYNLSEAQDYRVMLWSVDDQGQLGLAGVSDSLSTLSSTSRLSPVPRVWHADSPHLHDNDLLETVVKWEPSKELTCSYSIVVYGQLLHGSVYQTEVTEVQWFGLGVDEDFFLYNYMDYYVACSRVSSPSSLVVLASEGRASNVVNKEPEQLYSTTIRDLGFEATYRFMIRSITDTQESEKTELKFTTPSCLSVHKSLNVCLPPMPVISSVESVNSLPDESHLGYDVTIRWEAPELKPDYYVVELYAPTINGSIMSNVSGVENQITFTNIPLETEYQVLLTAVSPAGKSPKAYKRLQMLPNTGSTVSSVVIYAFIIPLASFLVFMGVAAFVYHRHEKMKLNKRRCRYFEELEQKAPHDVSATISINMEDDQFEVKPEHLLIYDVLGEGAFGVVKKGWYPDKNKEVAIKMLKDEPSAEEVKQFKQEIDMMKSVGSHPHIVSLLGCCTRPSATMMLVVEFCPKGDLQSYLRLAWDIMSSKIKPSSSDKFSYNEDKMSEQIAYTPLNSTNSGETSPNLIINKLYDYQDKLDKNITAIDLLSFSRQVAMGMEYLSLNRVVHRDLAARNVLVCNDKTVKIADFGLSRDIYQENVYRKTGTGKLPIKWMALECLTHQIYTTQSDVWSYGILMWEIITLGGNPYPSIPTSKLLKLLLSDYRMECPSNCSRELYALMMACWRARPKERPTFTELRELLDALLNGVCSKEYLSMDIINYKDIEDFRRVISDQPSRESDKSQEALKPSLDSDWYMMPITHKSPKQCLLNHYSIMPSQPPLYPAPTTTVESIDCVTKLMLSAQAANNNCTAVDSSRWC